MAELAREGARCRVSARALRGHLVRARPARCARARRFRRAPAGAGGHAGHGAGKRCRQSQLAELAGRAGGSAGALAAAAPGTEAASAGEAPPPLAGRASSRRRAAGATPGFSASLARHEGEIRLCFAHDTAAAASAGEVSFRFQIRADGHVTAVTVLPEALGATPLGVCLAKVGARTVFAAQPAPMTFRIPLTLRLQVADRAAR